jgi:hypothetical protein
VPDLALPGRRSRPEGSIKGSRALRRSSSFGRSPGIELYLERGCSEAGDIEQRHARRVPSKPFAEDGASSLRADCFGEIDGQLDEVADAHSRSFEISNDVLERNVELLGRVLGDVPVWVHSHLARKYEQLAWSFNFDLVAISCERRVDRVRVSRMVHRSSTVTGALMLQTHCFSAVSGPPASPVFGVPTGSIKRTCASSSARGQCSIPRGTTNRSPSSSSTSRSRS